MIVKVVAVVLLPRGREKENTSSALQKYHTLWTTQELANSDVVQFMCTCAVATVGARPKVHLRYRDLL